MRGRTPRHLGPLAASAAVLAALTAGGVALLTAPAAQAATGLASAAEAHGRYFGVAYATAHSGDSTYTAIAGSQFDMVTPENEMKWDTVEPSQGSFNFGPGDQVVAFAAAHSQRVRGHNLVWHSQLPGWMAALSGTTAQNAMRDHITAEVSHFQGKIYAWDVVNEPFNDDGSWRQDVFYAAYGGGPSYVAAALRAARTADPNAKLYLNDYNIEGSGAKADAMYALASTLKQQGVPLDGIGFETHLATQYGFPSGMSTNLQRFADLGLDVAVTELDVRMPLPEDATKDATQATYYTNVINACKAVSRCAGWSVWGVSDNYSWVPGTFSGQGAALIWDSAEQPKPLYTTVLNALGPVSSPPPTGSPSPTATGTPPPPPGGCAASYTVVNQWPGGFQAGVTITNGAAARTSWTVTWTFPSGQLVSQLWSGTYTQAGATVTVHNVDYNGVLAAGATTTFGFLGTFPVSNTSPTTLTCQ